MTIDVPAVVPVHVVVDDADAVLLVMPICLA